MTAEEAWQARWRAVYSSFVAVRCAELSQGHLEWTPEPALMRVIVQQAIRVANEQQRQFALNEKEY